jgi:hypothetical protein
MPWCTLPAQKHVWMHKNCIYTRPHIYIHTWHTWHVYSHAYTCMHNHTNSTRAHTYLCTYVHVYVLMLIPGICKSTHFSHKHRHIHAPHAARHHAHAHTPAARTPLLTVSQATWGPGTRPQAASLSDCCSVSCAGPCRVRAVRRLPHAGSRRRASARLAREMIIMYEWACVYVCVCCIGHMCLLFGSLICFVHRYVSIYMCIFMCVCTYRSKYVRTCMNCINIT